MLRRSSLVTFVAYVACNVSPLIRKMNGLPLLSMGSPGHSAEDMNGCAATPFAYPALAATVAATPPYFVELLNSEMVTRCVAVSLLVAYAPMHLEPLAPAV